MPVESRGATAGGAPAPARACAYIRRRATARGARVAGHRCAGARSPARRTMHTTSLFGDRLREHAGRNGGRDAIALPGGSIVYGELPGRVEACAHALLRQGLGPGDIAGVTVRDEALHLVVTLALLVLGIPQVSMGTHDPGPMRARLAVRIGVTRVVAADPDDRVDGLDLALVSAREPPVPGSAALPFHGADDAIALYLTGSGTTGEPKIVAVSERQLATQADRGYSDYGPERVLRLASVEHNNSKRLRLYCLWQGGTCVLRGDDRSSVPDLCRRMGVTWLDLATYHVEDLVRGAATTGRLPAHTRVRCGGSRAPMRLRLAFLAQVSDQLHVSYGTTEVGGVCISTPADHADPREPVGRPLPGVEVEIVDAERRPVAPGEVGEIRMRAAGMANGYIGDAVATRRHFDGGWFYPGDLVWQLPGGAICIQGRKDDMMILNGINIFPAEIERVLEGFPGVRQAACFPLRSAIHGEIPVAAVELDERDAVASSAIAAYARRRLGVRSPRRIVVVDSFPRNAHGKILKRELARLLRPDAEA